MSENLAKERQHLQWLLRKNNTTSWEDHHTKVVKRLKEKCKNLPRLGFPTSSDNLILETNASDNHWGCSLKNISRKDLMPVEHSNPQKKKIIIVMKKNY